MRIGLCGTHGVGKTTLLNALAGERVFKDYSILSEVTRWVKSLEIPINEAGSDATQYMIGFKHYYNLQNHPKMITDRTIIDCWAYSLWSNDRGKVSDECHLLITNLMYKMVPQYDFIFYMEPEFELEDDGVRSINENFHNEILENFKNVYRLWTETSKNVNIFKIGGSVSNRVQMVKDIILKEKLL